MDRRLVALSLLTLSGVYFAQPQESSQQPSSEWQEEVKYGSSEGSGIHLAGTFSRPKGEQPTPAVLLLSQAGPQDRDETVGVHKPFRVLADYLTQRGIAVLRADDRGVGESTGNFETANTKDFAFDAEAGVRFLTSRSDVEHKRIGLIGHGEGAIVAAITAAAMPERVAFLVLLNGTAVTGEKVLLAQTQRAQLAAGVPEEQVEADLRLGAGLYRMVRDGRSEQEMRQALQAVPSEYRSFTEAWRRQLPKLQSPWLKFFLSYDPSVALEQVKCPVLAIFGEKDMTIDPDQNASAMKAIFSHSHNHRAKVKTMSGLNDLLQKAKTGLPGEYDHISETISPAALEEIGNWIEKESQ